MRFRRYLGWTLGLLMLLVVTVPVSLLAQDRIPEAPLKERFFEELTRPQIVSLLETLDRGEQLTDFELGAKYRWGYIPPDRRPPVRLAQWWRSLSQRKRNNQRFQWFQEHYDQLDVDRAARELGQTSRLLKIQRDLQKNYGKTPDQLESVFFPGDTVAPPRTTDKDNREFAGTYRQTTDEPDQPGEMVPVSERDRLGSDEASGDDESDPSDTRDTEPRDSSVSDRESSTKAENGRSGVRYRRVGDDVQIVGESSTSERSSARNDTAGSEADRRTREDRGSDGSDPSLEGSPNLNLNNSDKKSTPWFPPQPSLRSGIPRPDLRVPNR